MAERALSIRGLTHEYGISREPIMAAVYAGDLTVARLSATRFVVLRSDFEEWLRSKAIPPDEPESSCTPERPAA